MYKITNNVKTYHSHTYAFVNKLKKGEIKQYDCFTWIYRMKELDNADYSINVVIFNFEGANMPLEKNMSYLELECYYLNEQARVVDNAYKALQVACDMFKIAGFEYKTVIDEVIHQYTYTKPTDEIDEWKEEENDVLYYSNDNPFYTAEENEKLEQAEILDNFYNFDIINV